MKQLQTRIWITAAIIALCYAGAVYVRAGYTFEVVPLARDLDSIPVELDGWSGSDMPIDERVQEILNAQESFNRVYRNRDGTSVIVSVSAWLRPETVSEVAPHLPTYCYINAGWKASGARDAWIDTSTGKVPFKVLLFERQSERIVVAYWYEMGGSYFTTSNEARRTHRDLWGQKKWPATVKVLLQTSASSIDAGLPAIERLAVLIQKELHTEASKDQLASR